MPVEEFDPADVRSDLRRIDALTHAFFDLFTQVPGQTVDLDAIHDLFIAHGLIIKAVTDIPEIYTVQQFIEPRISLLNDGSLTDFREEEVSASTDIFGNIAQRHSTYRKSGVLHGVPFATSGMKTLQFVRVNGTWKFSCVAWDDEREGLSLPAFTEVNSGTVENNLS